MTLSTGNQSQDENQALKVMRGKISVDIGAVVGFRKDTSGLGEDCSQQILWRKENPKKVYSL